MLDLGTLYGKIELDSKGAIDGLKNIKTNSDTANGGMLSLTDTFKGFAMKALAITVVITAVKKVADGIASCVNKALDLDKSLNGLQASTGATNEEMAGLETSLKNIYANNYGESFEDIANALAEVKTQTGLAGEELEKTTENALAMRDTFGMEVNESIRSVDMMMKQFGLTSDEAYNLIAQGAQNGLDKNDNLLDSVNEYSVHFSQLGFNAEEMFNMFSNGAKSGVFDIDKLGDAVKEFGIRAKDGSNTTVEAFNILNLNADEMQEKFAQGGEVAKEAFNEVIVALNNCDNEVDKNIAGVNLFGTMWEDLGADAISALTETNGAISITATNLEDIKNIKYDDFGSALAGIGRQLEIGIMLPIGEKILPILNTFANWINENLPKIKEVIGKIMKEISLIINSVLDIIKGIWEKWGNEITIYLSGFWEGLKITVETAINIIKDVINIVTALIKGDWEAVWENIKKLFSDCWEGIKAFLETSLNTMVNLIVSIGGKIKEKFIEIWNKVKATFREKWTEICEWFNKKITDIVDTVVGIKNKMFDAGKKIFTSLWDGIKSIWKNISDWVSEKVDWLIDKVTFWKSESSKMDSSSNADGSHRTGLRSVPFDDYRAILHKGEMVLTQPEAERYRQGQSSTSNAQINMNFYNVKEERTAFRVNREVKQTLKTLGFA